MVKRLIFVLLTVLVLGFTVLAEVKAPEGFRYITPTAFDRKFPILVSGKQRDYYLLEPGKRIEVKVQGPSQLRVLSRIILASAKDTTEYSYLALKSDSKKAVTISHKSWGSDKCVLPGESGVAGESRTKVVDVPKGEQSYSFYLPEKAGKRMLLRFAIQTNDFTAGTPVAAMTPTEFTQQVDLVSGEKVVPYYRIGHEQKVSLKLIGPATLKVLSRIEFDPSMTGSQKWKVQANEDGKVKGTYSLSAAKSDTVTYKEASSLVASHAETFYVEIPQGTHTYDFSLPENHRSVLMRFLLPKKQLAKE
jgi:hypothetical protein